MSESEVGFYEFVNKKLWLLTEQPPNYQEKLKELEQRYYST